MATTLERGRKTDKQIQLDVLAELDRDFRFRPAEIGVEVDQGVVTLTGTVSSYLKIGQAAELATAVSGVRDIANKLTVQGAPSSDDTQIAKTVRETLLWDADVPEERIESVVRDGVVMLKGTVDYQFQRQATRDAVARLFGVRSVNDHMIVAPKIRSDREIHDEIKATLRRRLPLEDIAVSVDGGAVTLLGKVERYRSRSEAEQAAWSTSAVKTVLNKIVVGF